MSRTIRSFCRCSPRGLTPLTALNSKRPWLHAIIHIMGWSLDVIEKQVRSFAIDEVFNRLGMTHTCVHIKAYGVHEVMGEEDRAEIEDEEEELNDQLEQLMEEYDLLRAEFQGGPLEFLDYFFESHEDSLWDTDKWREYVRNSNDRDLLSPGEYYQLKRLSFTGKQIYYDHREEVNEENMLALLFDEN